MNIHLLPPFMVQYGSEEATDLFALETVVSLNVASCAWNQGAGNNRHLCIWLEAFPEPVFILLSQSRISEQNFAFYDWDGNLESYGILYLVYTGSCILESWKWMYFDSAHLHVLSNTDQWCSCFYTYTSSCLTTVMEEVRFRFINHGFSVKFSYIHDNPPATG